MTQSTPAQLLSALLFDIRVYMTDVIDDGGDPGFTEAEVIECQEVLEKFLKRVEQVKGDDAAVLEALKGAVEDLNALNDECDGSLIETDERESICEFLNTTAREAGVGQGEDLTEQWREW